MATGNEKRDDEKQAMNPGKVRKECFAYALALTLSGCATPWFHKEKDPSEEYKKEIEEVKDLWRSEDRPPHN